ncbi:eukaryotic aspartyl protease family protein [Actinidia rufa]|uniref:Eukaryotic aspartyl protease family protein n=1 Tax=Actinidia rufa TaxID=165716 RepID=A0A7J0GH22_9ERIC|nr:eukaryotic aspartyl protease family protein [Actinidia rufa]
MVLNLGLGWLSRRPSFRPSRLAYDRDLSEYIPLVSNTSKRISCSHHLCELSPTCKSPKEPCPYNVDYYSENTSSSGFLFEDELQLASVGDYVSQSLVQASVIIGCGRKQSGSYLDGAAPDGIMGLGLGDISVPSLLAKAALIQNSFSLCIDETYSGRIVFGDQGFATQQSTLFLPLQGKYITYLVEVTHYCIGSSCLKQTGFQALVDSGTSFTYLPHEIYEKVVLEFDKRVDARKAGLEGFPYCYEASSQDLLNIPSMELIFAMNQSFVIENPMFQITDNQQTGFQALVDSGTSFTYLPHEIYEKVVLEFDKRVDARKAGLEGFPYCYEASSQDLLNIPSMELIFAMNQSFVIENPMFQITDNQFAYAYRLLPLSGFPTILALV